MPNAMDRVLDDFEAGLAPADYDRLIAAFRALEIPGDVDGESLERLYGICYRILGIAPDAQEAALGSHMEPWQIGHLQACAASAIEESLYDRNARTRAWIHKMEALYESRRESTPKGLNDHQLPPALVIPWDAARAKNKIAPFLAAYEANLAEDPYAHFKLCYDVMTDGYPVFREVFESWMEDLERRGLGQPGMAEGLREAARLGALAKKTNLSRGKNARRKSCRCSTTTTPWWPQGPRDASALYSPMTASPSRKPRRLLPNF
ncbi:MAG: hypothetical protein ACPW61_10185 [Methyloligella sp. ZOD6]